MNTGKQVVDVLVLQLRKEAVEVSMNTSQGCVSECMFEVPVRRFQE